jgi:hypothetical protein
MQVYETRPSRIPGVDILHRNDEFEESTMKRSSGQSGESVNRQRSRRFLTLAAAIMAFSLILTACAPATAPTAPAPAATQPPQPTAAPAATQAPQPTVAPTATQAQPTAAAPAAPKATEAPAATATKAPAPTEKPAATATQAPVAAPAGVSFTKDVLPIFQQSCIKCHGGEKTEAMLSLKEYAGVVAGSENGPVVKASSAADSELVKLVTQGKMPKRANRLPDSQIKILTDWVNAGAPNN